MPPPGGQGFNMTPGRVDSFAWVSVLLMTGGSIVIIIMGFMFFLVSGSFFFPFLIFSLCVRTRSLRRAAPHSISLRLSGVVITQPYENMVSIKYSLHLVHQES